jgi:heptaprenyl diphosphate synthase
LRARTPLTAIADVEFGDPQLASNVRDGVARIEELINNELSQSDELIRDEVPPLLEAEGFRFKPLFTVLAAQFGRDPGAGQVTVAGAAIELIDQATRCHSRVADEADPRSNASSVDTRWSNNIAILAGDYRLAAASRLGSRLGSDAYRDIAETFAELIIGRMRETRWAATHVDSVEDYLRVAQQKTGSLLAASGRFGATFSGAAEAEIHCLSRLGDVVGTGIQVLEDISAISDSSGADLRDVSGMLPVLYALLEEEPDAARLRELLTEPIDDNFAAEALTLLRSSPGMPKAKNMLAGYATEARELLGELPDCVGRSALAILIDSTLSRHDD